MDREISFESARMIKDSLADINKLSVAISNLYDNEGESYNENMSSYSLEAIGGAMARIAEAIMDSSYHAWNELDYYFSEEDLEEIVSEEDEGDNE